MREFLSKYSARDQMMLIIGAVFVVCWASYMFLIAPLAELKSQNEDDLIANTELLSWMESSAAEVRALGGTRTQNRIQGGNSSAVVLVETALKQGGLPNPNRITPNGNDKATIQYEAVSFDKLMRTLDKLEHNYGINVAEGKFSNTETPGMVSINVNLERAR